MSRLSFGIKDWEAGRGRVLDSDHLADDEWIVSKNIRPVNECYSIWLYCALYLIYFVFCISFVHILYHLSVISYPVLPHSEEQCGNES